MSRLLWIVLALIGGGLLVLVLNHDSGETFGLRNDAFARTLYLGVWALVIGAALIGARIPFGQAARGAAIWIAVLLMLVAAYQYRHELNEVASRVGAGFLPGRPVSLTGEDGIAVLLDKSLSGHFEVRGEVDGVAVDFLIDTGATTTVLTHADARRVGIDPAGLRFTVPVLTANGETRAARSVAGEIRVGDIVRRRVPVLVAEEGRLGQSLIGMNYLATLSGFDVRGDRLILRD
jgi:aspartyl protease family protein